MARPEVLAFLRCIKEDPHDDTPRLILADWLDEHGDEADSARAELIRLQCEQAHLDDWDPRRVALEARALELQYRHGSRWLGPLAAVEEVRWQRGLVHLVLTPQKFLSEPVAGLPGSEAYAWVEGLVLRDWTSDVFPDVFQAPELASIGRLEIGDSRLAYSLGPALQALITSPYLTSLRELALGRHSLEEAGAAALATAPFLEQLTSLELGYNWRRQPAGYGPACPILLGRLFQLTRLDLSWNHLGRQIFRDLAGCPALARLRFLDLTGSSISETAFRILVESPYLCRLQRLELARCDLGGDLMLEEGAKDEHQPLAEASPNLRPTHLNLSGNHLPNWRMDWLPSPLLAELTSLDLGDNNLGAQALASLARSPSLTRLTHLRLGSNPLDKEGLRELLACPFLAHLVSLDLSRTRLGPSEVRPLAATPSLSGLQRLALSYNQFSAADALALAGSPHLGRLVALELAGNGLGNKGMRALASALALPHLGSLNLSANQISSRGIRALASCPGLASLLMLDLGQNQIDREGGRSLAGSPHLAGLHVLRLGSNRLGSVGVSALARSEHLGKVYELDLSNNVIDEAGVEALASSDVLAGLYVLDLSDNPVGERGALALAESAHLERLRFLRISDITFGTKGQQALHARFGNRVTLLNEDIPF